jgi:hypothetical protein
MIPSVSSETASGGLFACSLSDTTVVLSYTDLEEAERARSSSKILWRDSFWFGGEVCGSVSF